MATLAELDAVISRKTKLARIDELLSAGGGDTVPSQQASFESDPVKRTLMRLGIPIGDDFGQDPQKFDFGAATRQFEESGVESQLSATRDQPLITPGPSLGERVSEAFTGDLRQTEDTRNLPRFGELNIGTGFIGALSETVPELRRILAFTTSSSPSEFVKELQEIIPGFTARTDEKGNLIGIMPDGREGVINPPGLGFTDFLKLGSEVAKFAPATRIAGGLSKGLEAGVKARILTQMIGAGLTSTVNELTDAAQGGDFEPMEIAMETFLTGGGEAVGEAISAFRLSRKADLKDAVPVGDVSPRDAPTKGFEPTDFDKPIVDVPAAKPAAPVEHQTIAEIGSTARKAAEGSTRAKQVLAEQASPDPKIIESAKRLGIDEFLQPDHVSTNQSFREFSQAVKSIPGSQARAQELIGYEAIGKRADDLITELGGTTDLSQLDSSVKGRLSDSISELEDTAKELYDALRDTIPARAPVDADNLLGFIRNKADELGGEEFLEPIEKRLLKVLSESDEGVKPTYARLDNIRRQLTSARVRKEGPFKDEATGLIKKLEKELLKDQKIVAEEFDSLELFDAARTSVAIRKGLESDMASLFGKALDKTIIGDLSSATKKLSAGDTSKFLKLIKAIPTEMREEVVSSALNTAFGKNAKNGQLNFTSFAKWYEGLLANRQSFNLLMRNLPEGSRKRLSDLYRVSNGIRKASRERITTGRISAVINEIQGSDNLMSKVYGAAKRSVVGSVAGVAIESITTPMGVPGAGLSAGIASAIGKGRPDIMKAADDVISNPQFIQTAINPTKETAEKLSKTPAFKKFAKAVGDTLMLNDPKTWILSAIRADRSAEQSQPEEK